MAIHTSPPIRLFELLAILAATAALTVACSSSDSSDSSSGSGGSSGSGSGGSAGGSSSGGKLGDNCSKVDDCASPENICIKAGGATVGFCTHSCTKSADCPSSGWECNLSPYTACVPTK